MGIEVFLNCSFTNIIINVIVYIFYNDNKDLYIVDFIKLFKYLVSLLLKGVPIESTELFR